MVKKDMRNKAKKSVGTNIAEAKSGGRSENLNNDPVLKGVA